MVALETEFLLARQEINEREAPGDVETYVFIFDSTGNIFLSGNEKTGLDTIHAKVDPKATLGGWMINELQAKGLSEDDLSGLSVFPETFITSFQGKKIEIVGILADQKTGRKLIDKQRDPAGFIGIDLLVNWDYEFLTPSGLGKLVDQLSLQGVLGRTEIFVPDGR
jgi:hypothetical protein